MEQDNTKSEAGKADSGMSDMLSAIRQIESALDVEKSEPVSSELSFSFPLAEALRLIPQQHVKEPAAGTGPDKTITIGIDNLYAQLARGKVSISVAELAYFIPSHLLARSAFEDKATMVSLPLAIVVKAVGAQALRKRTSQNTRCYDIGGLDDPFAKPDTRPAVEDEIESPAETAPAKVEKPAVPAREEPPPAPPPPAPEEVTPPVPEVTEETAQPATAEAVAQAAEEPAPAEPQVPVEQPPEPAEETAKPVEAPAEKAEIPSEPVEELDFVEMPGCMNVNTATVQDLMTLAGMTEPLAAKIVEWRTQHGPFKTIFDLCSIPRFNRKIFKQITGMPYTAKKEHRRVKLAAMLHIQPAKAGNLSVVAAAVANAGGFAGCVISDKDGLLLAESGAGKDGETLGAIAPKTVRQIMENMQLLSMEHLDSVTMGVKGTLYTMVAAPHAVLTAIHEESRITRAQLLFARKAAKELSWLLSHRVYVGRAQ